MTKISKIREFFMTIFALSMFAIKTLWVILKDDMKKNVQTYKEEREQQKKIKKKNGK